MGKQRQELGKETTTLKTSRKIVYPKANSPSSHSVFTGESSKFNVLPEQICQHSNLIILVVNIILANYSHWYSRQYFFACGFASCNFFASQSSLQQVLKNMNSTQFNPKAAQSHVQFFSILYLASLPSHWIPTPLTLGH